LVTGRLYALTERGRDDVHAAFGILIPEPPNNIDWRKYSWVVRAKIRRLALTALGQMETNLHTSQTATAVRKHLRETHSVGLNPVIRAIKDLVKLGLVMSDSASTRNAGKQYRLTKMGRRILHQLNQ
jgi:DNA-binding PadR family transcriptional regulator